MFCHWVFIFIEINKYKFRMNNIKYHMNLGVRAAFTKVIMTATNKLGQSDMKGATKDCFLFNSCFYSIKLAEAAMDVGADMIGMVKTNIKVFFKENFDIMTDNWPGGSYLVLRSKPMVPVFRLIIAILYKYNMWNVMLEDN